MMDGEGSSGLESPTGSAIGDSETSRTPSGPWWTNLLVVACALLVSAGLAELGIRWMRPAWKPPPVEGFPFFRPDPRLGWALREGASGPFELGDRVTQVTISEQGFRDREHGPRPPAGWTRILLLGDSFAWGFGVEKRETFEVLLEHRLQNVEIVNAAVPGYGTDQEWLTLEARGPDLRPDMVLLLFHPNDLLNNTWRRQYGYPKPVFRLRDGVLELDNVPVPGGAFYEMRTRALRSSYLLHRAWATFAEPTQDLLRSPTLAWDVTEALLVRMQQWSDRRDARFAVITFPWNHAEIEGLLDRVRQRIDRRGIHRLELGPSLPDGLIDPATEHWTAEGHRAVAAALEPLVAGLWESDPADPTRGSLASE